MPNGNNYKKWDGTVDQWRGYITAEIKNLKEELKEQKKVSHSIKEDITKIKEYIIGRKAVERFINILVGFIASIIGAITVLFSKMLK